MPKTLSTCAEPGCPELTDASYCDDHAPDPWQSSQRRERVGKSGWQQQRDAQRILKRDHGICHRCKKPGADQVDHVVPIAEGGADTDANKAAIHATPCHRDKTAEESARARRAEATGPR